MQSNTAFFVSFFRSLLRIVFSVFAPVLLVFSGAGIAGLGLSWSLMVLVWTGLILVAAGLFLGVIVYGDFGSIGDDDSW